MNQLELVRANNTRRTEIQGELREIDEAATTENRSYSEEETGRITELRTEMDAVHERMATGLEMAVRSAQLDNGLANLAGVLVDQNSGEVYDERSLGERFTQAEGYTEWAAGANGKFRHDFAGVDIRSVTDTTLGSTSGGALTRPQRLARIGQQFLDRKVFLSDLIPTIPVGQGTIEYVQDQTPLADLADKPGLVAEGGTKPQGGVTMAVIQEPTATIAEWVNYTRQVAADVPQVAGYLDGKLRYALKRKLDAQVIGGDGTGTNLTGLKNRSGIVTYAPGSPEARYRSIRHAMRLGEDAEAVYEIIVLAPADAEIFDLSNDTSAGIHVQPDDQPLGTQRTAWGLTQVRSTALANGTALLIDPMAVGLFDRQQATAYTTDSHASNFTSNMLTLLLELRAGLGLFDLPGVCKVTFNGTV